MKLPEEELSLYLFLMAFYSPSPLFHGVWIFLQWRSYGGLCLLMNCHSFSFFLSLSFSFYLSLTVSPFLFALYGYVSCRFPPEELAKIEFAEEIKAVSKDAQSKIPVKELIVVLLLYFPLLLLPQEYLREEKREAGAEKENSTKYGILFEPRRKRYTP
jgi:hypothetical protein